MKFGPNARSIGLVAWFLLIWALSLVAIYLDWGWTLWPLRAAIMLGIFGLVANVMGTPKSPMLISPLVLLGALAGIAYSILPAIFFFLYGDDAARPRFFSFVGELPELLILGFSAACLTIAAGLRFGVTTETEIESKPNHTNFPALALIPVAIALSILYVFSHKYPDWLALPNNHWTRDLLDATAPILALLTAYSAVAAMYNKQPRWFVVLALATTLQAFVLGQYNNIKVAAFSFMATIIYICLSLPRRAVFAFILPITLVAIIAVGIANSAKSHHQSDWLSADVILSSIYFKLVYRQLDTGTCFAKAIDSTSESHPFSDTLQFFIGIVPRVIWSSKPNLSVGQEHAWQYCSIRKEDAEIWAHSASVTLLGDPVILAGWKGLLIAEATLLIGLAAVTHLAFYFGRTGVTALLALTPWTIDFDQHFSLYLAQALKCFLYMLPFLILMRLSERSEWIERQ